MRSGGNRVIAVVLVLGLVLDGCGGASKTVTATTVRVTATARAFQSVGFWTGWQGVPLSGIPWNSLTELNMFSDTTQATSPFLDTSNHGMTPSLQQQFVSLVHQHHRLALLTIGGSEDQTWNVACAAANRSTFINAAVGQVRIYGYDGLDLDIEQDFGAPAHTDFNACVHGFNAALKSTTTAAGAVPLLTEDEDPSWQYGMVAPLASYLDRINLMDYGATCASSCAGVARAISNNAKVGIPASKLTEGIGLDPGDPQATDTADCGAIAQYAATHGIAGVMFWTIQDDYLNHGGRYPCIGLVTARRPG